MKNTKGLSTIVATLIIILLVMVAIGIIWVVVSNMLEGGAGNVDVASKCQQVDMKIKSVPSTCLGQVAGIISCVVTVERASGGDSAAVGYRVILENPTTSVFQDQSGTNALSQLETKSPTVTVTSIVNVTKVKVAPYFTVDGETKPCSVTDEYP
ncbi:MAG: hypothetical protein AABW81_03800 [Nanoarchaeota archaeon]